MMRWGTRLALSLAPLLLAACASSHHSAPDVDLWPGLDEGSSYYLGDGGDISVDYGGEVVRRVTVRDGTLYLGNDRNPIEHDLGPYAASQPIRFHDDGRVTVSGKTRIRVGLP